MLQPIEKQAYKLKLSIRWKIYDVFHMSLLEQNTRKKGQMNKFVSEFKTENNKEYKVETI